MRSRTLPRESQLHGRVEEECFVFGSHILAQRANQTLFKGDLLDVVGSLHRHVENCLLIVR